MTILIAYATTDGQTRKIARFAADRLTRNRRSVALVDLSLPGTPDPSRFEAVILAGSLHAGGYQRALVRFVKTHRAVLGKVPNLFLPVSLSAAGHDGEDWKGLAECLATFQKRTGWTPRKVEHVAGAFRFSEYDFLRACAMRRVAQLQGIEPGRDREFTDWAALGLALDAWQGSVPIAAAA